MNQEQLMKQKIKYLEDRITTMEKSLSRINNILGRFQMTEDNDQGFKDLDKFRDSDTMESDHELI